MCESPHAAQVVMNGGVCLNCIPFGRVLTGDMPRLVYQRRNAEVKTVVHWGQRKLLMSEIEFLTLHEGPEQTVVVYAGAAPGTHAAMLSKMFPRVLFILVDPAPFSVKPSDRIQIVRALFSQKMAKKLGKKHPGLLFISDIRSGDRVRCDSETLEHKIQDDMKLQMEWHLSMKPRRSMLKCRLPWTAGQTEYLDGDLYLPVWGPITTTETRLITTENCVTTKAYNNVEYEERMFYFNTVARPALYDHGVSGEGIDNCYDCRAEVGILSAYLSKHGVHDARMVAALSKLISTSIAPGRTLLDPTPDPASRDCNIRKKQWINGRPAYER